MKIFKAGIAYGSGSPGTVLHAGKKGIEVACGGGSLIIEELQMQGRKRLGAAEFLAGCRMEPGILLGEKDTSRE